MKKKIIGQSKSSRLNPSISVQNESSSGEHSECENDMDKTIIDTSCEQKAMEDFKKQLDEMRLQLQTALACVATEKQEKLRLQEILTAQQISVVVSTSDVTSPYTTAPATSSAHLASATNMVTATSAGNICTEVVLPQSLPTQWSGMLYTQSQPTVSALPLVGDTGTLLTSIKVPQIPSFLPPLFESQQFCSNQIEASPTVRAMPTMSSASASVQNNLYSPQALAFRKLHDLPEFTGKPEDWPLFCTTFRDSTAMYGYTNVDNLLRLQKALKGSAREVVEAMLIHPSSINQAMAALEFRFGRPDILLRSQLLKLREISPISEDSLELLIPFATKVQNLSCVNLEPDFKKIKK